MVSHMGLVSQSAGPDHWHCRLTPESLDPRALRLLWGQRELEIQALRWAIQNRPDARHCHVLQEVAGIPPERCAAECWARSPTQPRSWPELLVFA